jgi:hypothetical protein
MNKNINGQYTNNESLSTSNYSEEEPIQPIIPEDEDTMIERNQY